MSWGDKPDGPLILQPQDSPGHSLAPWFATWREDRAARRAQPHGSKTTRRRRSRAVITMVYNEPVFLPLWLRYYSRFFRPDEIYVLDNESTCGVPDQPGFTRIPVAHDTVDHTWMVRTIESLQHDLLDRHDVVVVTDVDEIIAPVPEWGTLGEYLDALDEEWVNCLGYEVLHLPDREPPLRLDEPILDQRGYWFPTAAYDKAAVATVPMTWRPGFHGRVDFQFRPDPDLRLIHLHRMDYDLCRQRHRTRRRRAWAETDKRRRWALHNRIVEDEDFDRWFSQDSCFEGFEIKLERISAAWRGRF